MAQEPKTQQPLSPQMDWDIDGDNEGLTKPAQPRTPDNQTPAPVPPAAGQGGWDLGLD